MDDILINGKAIYTTKGAAREYGRVGCNFYTGCPHECEYCYLKRGITGKALGGTEVRLKKCFKDKHRGLMNDKDYALIKFKQEVFKYVDVLRQTGIFFSFTTDPMIPETRVLTLQALDHLYWMKVPATVLTKDASWLDDNLAKIHLSTIISDQRDISFGFTLTGRDDMEPKASSNADRIKAMRYLHDSGLKTWASIEPVIDWQHANMVVEMSLDCCDHYKIGLRSGVRKDYYDPMESCQMLGYLTKLITDAGKTVYLKESARQLLRLYFAEDYYNEIISRTVDADGKTSTNLQDETNRH